MKGHNVLKLNQGTMMEAVEFYLKHEVMKEENFEVIAVKEDGNVFIVEIRELEEETKAKLDR